MGKTKTRDRGTTLRHRSFILTILHLMLAFGPLFVAVVVGLVDKTISPARKLAIPLGVVVIAVGTVLNLMAGTRHHRYVPYVALVAIALTMRSLVAVLIVMTCTTLVDDVVVLPLKERTRTARIAYGEVRLAMPPMEVATNERKP